jgi:hypothetical protein
MACDLWEDVVSAEQYASLGVVEADVLGGVAGGPYDCEFGVGEV